MRKHLKLVTLLATLALIIATIMPMEVKASETTQIDPATKKAVAEEMKFYFNEVGHLNENNQYVIHDIQKLRDRANTGDPTATALLKEVEAEIAGSKNVSQRSVKDFAGCVLMDTFGLEISILSGDLYNTLVEYIKNQWWDAVAEVVIKDILKQTAKKANIVTQAAQLAISAFKCRGKY